MTEINFVKMDNILLTAEQLKEQSRILNAQNGVDYKKLIPEFEKQIQKENNIYIGILNDGITRNLEIIKKLEEEKEFFNFKISKLECGDSKIIKYEKELYKLDKSIEDINKSIENTREEIKSLNKKGE